MSEREGQTMEMQTAVETQGAYTEIGQAGGGDITIYVEGEDGMVKVTWTEAEAKAVHSLLGHLLYG